MNRYLTYDNTKISLNSSIRGNRDGVKSNLSKKSSKDLLKSGIWLYFALLICEGALRKWVFPQLAAPLLIIRDPIALWLVLIAGNRGIFSKNIISTGMVLIGIAGIFTATLFGHGSLPVALYGARIFLIHFPLIFVIGKTFNRDDVIQLGKLTMWISIPMTILLAVQFYSPQSAWVNLGVAGNAEGSGFSGALGYYRSSGTFSFTTGVTQFYSLVGCFLLYFWLQRKMVSKLMFGTLLLTLSSVCFLAAIPLSISRGLFFQVLLSFVFVLTAVSRRPKYFWRVTNTILVGGIIVFFLNKTNVFKTATAAFASRFDEASEVEGGLRGTFGDRFLGGMLKAISESFELPFFGYGMGMGTNVGAQLLTGDRTVFLISEEEWGRVIGELGILMGFAVILLRLSFSIKLTIACYQRLTVGDVLPWMLLSFGLLIIAQGQWAQPTTLGFSTLLGGLIFASAKIPVPDRIIKLNDNL